MVTEGEQSPIHIWYETETVFNKGGKIQLTRAIWNLCCKYEFSSNHTSSMATMGRNITSHEICHIFAPRKISSSLHNSRQLLALLTFIF